MGSNASQFPPEVNVEIAGYLGLHDLRRVSRAIPGYQVYWNPRTIENAKHNASTFKLLDVLMSEYETGSPQQQAEVNKTLNHLPDAIKMSLAENILHVGIYRHSAYLAFWRVLIESITDSQKVTIFEWEVGRSGTNKLVPLAEIVANISDSQWLEHIAEKLADLDVYAGSHAFSARIKLLPEIWRALSRRFSDEIPSEYGIWLQNLRNDAEGDIEEIMDEINVDTDDSEM